MFVPVLSVAFGLFLLPVVEPLVGVCSRPDPAGTLGPEPPAAAAHGAGVPGHLPPQPGGGPAGRARGAGHRRQRAAGAGRGALPRHRQDAEVRVLRGEPAPGLQQARRAEPEHERPGDRGPRQGRHRAGPQVAAAPAGDRLHPRAPRHHGHGVLLPQGARGRRQRDGEGGRLPLPGTQAAVARDGDPDAGRRHRGGDPLAGQADAGAHPRGHQADHRQAHAQRRARRVAT